MNGKCGWESIYLVFSPPLSTILWQLRAAPGNPSPSPFPVFRSANGIFCSLSYPPIPVILLQLLASHGNLFSPQVFVISWQLVVANGYPSPSTISAIPRRLAATKGSSFFRYGKVRYHTVPYGTTYNAGTVSYGIVLYGKAQM